MPSDLAQDSRRRASLQGPQIPSRPLVSQSWPSVQKRQSGLSSDLTKIWRTDLEKDSLISQMNLKFLSSVLVLLRPLGVVFPVEKKKVRRFLLLIYLGLLRLALLQNLAGPNNALDLVDHQRANTHYGSIRQHLVRRSWRARGIQLVGIHTLFADQAIVSVVGVVGITRNCAAAVSYGLEIEFYQPHRSARKSQGSWMRHGKPNRETHARIAQSDPSCEANVSDCP